MSEVTRRSGSSTRRSRRTTRSKGVNNMNCGNNDIEETKEGEEEKACVQPDAIPSSISSRSTAADSAATPDPAASTGSTTRQSVPTPAAFVEKDFCYPEEEEVPVARKPRKQPPRLEVKHEDIRPCSVSSSSSSMAAISTHPPVPNNSNEREKKKTAPTPTPRPAPVAFVEKDFIKQDPEAEEEGEEEETKEREAKTAPLPETINSSDTTTSKQPTTKEYNDGDNNNNIEGVAVKREDSLPDDHSPIKINNDKRRKQGSIKAEEIDDKNDISQMNTRRSNRRKRKQPQSSSILTQACDSDDDDSTSPDYSLQTNHHRKKRQRKNNQQGGKPAVASSTTSTRRTSPRNKKHQHQNDIIISPTDNNDNSTVDETNCCKLCNDRDWDNKIYFKCGTVISKYFPKSNNNPNPGWYKGTIRIHHVSSANSGSSSDSDSDSEYEEEADSRSEEERSERQQIIYNEIHYEDGDTENITQDHLKLQLMDSRKVKILHPTKMTTTSNSEGHNPVVDVAPTTTSSDNQHDRKWFAMYGRLQQFKADNGHCRVPWNYGPDPSLANWVKMQRKTYKQRKLAEDRVEKLDDIGFEWAIVTETPDQAWQEKYERLKQFKAKNGHCRVPRKYGKDPSLANWVTHQRKFYNKGTLAEDRTEKLNKIGFDWDAFDQTWQEKYDRLKTYREENGHCRVPAKYDQDPSLGFWVINQRRRAFHKQLAEDRAEKLNKIGFDWDLDDLKWDEMFGRLEQFKAKSGHCRVPRNYRPDPPLGLWVTNQRKKYKKGIMSNDRVEKLNKISFDWDAFDRSWDEMFGRLEKFKEENGHCRVPPRYGSHPSLGNWVSKQRKIYKQRKLAEDRVEKLDKIGFDWDPYNQTWDEMFGRLEQFKTENSHCRVPQNYGPDPSLGSWVSWQRTHYKTGKLAKNRAMKLEEIDFEWNPRNYRNTKLKT